MKYTVLLRRNSDGAERWTRPYEMGMDDLIHPGLIAFSWLENNYSCDCNRSWEFSRAASEPEDNDPPCGHSAFSLLAIKREDGRLMDLEKRDWINSPLTS